LKKTGRRMAVTHNLKLKKVVELDPWDKENGLLLDSSFLEEKVREWPAA
jgi:hypothetical protein